RPAGRCRSFRARGDPRRARRRPARGSAATRSAPAVAFPSSCSRRPGTRPGSARCASTRARSLRDGTWAIDLDPLSLLSRLAAAVPPPRQHTVRYAGVLAAAAKWRPAIVPHLPFDNDAEPVAPSSAPAATPPSPPTHRSKYRPFVELLRRTFAIDLETCDHCGGRTKVIALVRDPAGIVRFLRHLGEPTEPPPLSPARAPPYFNSRVLRRRPADQGELFGV